MVLTVHEKRRQLAHNDCCLDVSANEIDAPSPLRCALFCYVHRVCARACLAPVPRFCGPFRQVSQLLGQPNYTRPMPRWTPGCGQRLRIGYLVCVLDPRARLTSRCCTGHTIASRSPSQGRAASGLKWGVGAGAGGRDIEGKGPQRRPQKRLDRRLEEVAEAVGGGYCRLQMPMKLALAARETVAGHRLEGGGGGSPPSNASRRGSYERGVQWPGRCGVAWVTHTPLGIRHGAYSVGWLLQHPNSHPPGCGSNGTECMVTFCFFFLS